jgi:predicted nucleic acid-binding protein
MTKEDMQKLYIFIDSNIFLNFYDFHHEDLERLAQLAELVESGGIELFTTKQVRNEVYRHRETRLAEAYEKFKASKVAIEMPVVCQAYPEYSEIKKTQSKLFDIKSKLSKKLWSDITSRSLEADKIIKRLLDVATEIDSDSVLEKAKTRYALGNPPWQKERTLW